jgi:hypothetical protein
MNRNTRPLSVTILSWLYIGVGAVGFVFHFSELLAFHGDSMAIELTELLAILCGVFMLRGRNWARWLALAWMAFHVAISYPVPRQIAIHFLFLAVIAWVLFHPAAMRFFGGPASRAI